MAVRNYTIGMAGHIDHGKTSLTKALTNVDTDRLKEEKERNISIELGYAPLKIDDELHVSIIDVPGHERFIRQMIAGVAGIDLVILVIAADEGVMPQTKEHLEILSFLGIEKGIIAISKIDRVDEELLELAEEDIRDNLKGTVFESAPFVLVDSLSKKGLEELKQQIKKELEHKEMRDARGPFRLPIDQVFSVQGQGTVVRGTVYEGIVEKGSSLQVLPQGIPVKVRQIQVHHEQTEVAKAGQRAALNLGGISKQEIARGDVLVSSEHFLVTDTLDITTKFVGDLASPVKQRAPIKLHTGTTEVMGTIVFFDRNEVVEEDDEVVCQLRLDHPIVCKRGDRFILRRPTPVETIGGGWIIDPKGSKYRFGEDTIKILMQKKEGTPNERILSILKEKALMTFEALLKFSSMDKDDLTAILNEEKGNTVFELASGEYALYSDFEYIKNRIEEKLTEYHEEFSLRVGFNKAEIVHSFLNLYPKRLVEFVLEKLVEEGFLKKQEQYIQLATFSPHYPEKWSKRMEAVVAAIQNDDIEVQPLEQYMKSEKIPELYKDDFKYYLIQARKAVALDENHLLSIEAINKAANLLKSKTGEEFAVKDAKDILGLSRKYLIPLLELFDALNLTKRVEDKRKWV
ncbi:selenocysteine-specific translation elongation factor [Schinkia azotoformans]|uniref:selenocysteine-specific translation elongation factor n=1 Tax=Schinkia azotoformans TaxID=1454 RepID=UPI002DC0134E|nr:selenocysteine-specific translation elongation factor [Schinkia azotoformans]MEC1742977.1 selenocysteine-specific translation elongation factor [Schinkia azotoformans]MEC1745347.1 selenocysteine-specific translation elongation factor [Schinkia azotoformans]MEC1757046.1 selenocysteine-specific translation elongation factor [Schinkia azotoformans]MEC1768209.1 selenocysteine-specific translation elongation factor [Schinkia azotoformans]MEC1789569.1 selenocysteine-specific translation elongatio